MNRHLLIVTSLALPQVLFAASINTFGDMVDFFLSLINLAIPVIFALSLLVFVWGIFQGWIMNAGTEAGIDRGKNMAVAGVIGLIVMTGMWGIVALAQSFIRF